MTADLRSIFLIPLLGMALAGAHAAYTAEAGPDIVPAVQRWTPASGEGTVAKPCVIELDAKFQGALAAVATEFRDDLSALGFGEATIRSSAAPSSGAIFLTIAKLPETSPQQDAAYSLTVGDGVRISAESATGIFNGTRSLLQMLHEHPDGRLPRGEIFDYPQYARRMLMIDVARRVFTVPQLEDFMRIMSWYKMNELHLHLSDDVAFRIQSQKFPGLAAADFSYSRKDLRDLQDFAEARDIAVTPEIDMPGHATPLTAYWPELRNPTPGFNPKVLDVSNPKTAETMKALLDEMIPLFDAPDFHIGTDEYHMGSPKFSPEQMAKVDQDFVSFTNGMDEFVRSRGKQTRIWSGSEGIGGPVTLNPRITIDMWVTHDAKNLMAKGHKVISSSDGRTYIVPGAHYYGVSNKGIYETWEPWLINSDVTQDPSKDDPRLLGGKLHIWNDQGPAGYTVTEIADLAMPSIQAFAEKLWGTKGSPTYAAFQQRAALTAPVPDVHLFDRMPAGKDGVVLDLPQEETLAGKNATIPLPLEKAARADLEYPWTLTMEICKSAGTGTRGVILGSDLVEVCSDYSRTENQTTKGVDGKEIKTKVTKVGLGLVRAAGSIGKDPAGSGKVDQVSRVYGDAPPLNQWAAVTIVGEAGKTTVFVDGKKAGESNNQMVCPLRRLGSNTGNSFVGKIRNLRVVNYAIVPPVQPVPVAGNQGKLR